MNVKDNEEKFMGQWKHFFKKALIRKDHLKLISYMDAAMNSI